jgi:hypothetical protein
VTVEATETGEAAETPEATETSEEADTESEHDDGLGVPLDSPACAGTIADPNPHNTDADGDGCRVVDGKNLPDPAADAHLGTPGHSGDPPGNGNGPHGNGNGPPTGEPPFGHWNRTPTPGP